MYISFGKFVGEVCGEGSFFPCKYYSSSGRIFRISAAIVSRGARRTGFDHQASRLSPSVVLVSPTGDPAYRKTPHGRVPSAYPVFADGRRFSDQVQYIAQQATTSVPHAPVTSYTAVVAYTTSLVSYGILNADVERFVDIFFSFENNSNFQRKKIQHEYRCSRRPSSEIRNGQPVEMRVRVAGVRCVRPMQSCGCTKRSRSRRSRRQPDDDRYPGNHR